MNYDTWLQSDRDFEKFHGLDEFHPDAIKRKREREEKKAEREIQRWKEERKDERDVDKNTQGADD